MLKKISLITLIGLNSLFLNLSVPEVKAGEFEQYHCVNVKGSFDETDRRISLGRRVRRPILYSGLSSNETIELTCEVQDTKATNLTISVALPDASDIEIMGLFVYLENKLVKKIQLKRGQGITYTLPLKGKGTKNFSIRCQHIQGGSDQVYIMKMDTK